MPYTSIDIDAGSPSVVEAESAPALEAKEAAPAFEAVVVDASVPHWRCRKCKQWFPVSEFKGQEKKKTVVCKKCVGAARSAKIKKDQDWRESHRGTSLYFGTVDPTNAADRPCFICKKLTYFLGFHRFGKRKARRIICSDCCKRLRIESDRVYRMYFEHRYNVWKDRVNEHVEKINANYIPDQYAVEQGDSAASV